MAAVVSKILLWMVFRTSLLVLVAPSAWAQDSDEELTVLERLAKAEARIAELRDSAETTEEDASGWTSLYDEGFLIQPVDKLRNPFQLQINGRIQFRYSGFARDRAEWVDQAGVVRLITNRNEFEIERGRLEFRGFFWDPALQFFINMDSDTDDNHQVIFHDFWMNYEFSEGFNLHFGKAFVPGSREWLNGSTRTRFSDRSMATTFFRPDRSVGMWVSGEPVDDLFYRVMLANGFNTSDLETDQIDDRLAYAASAWINFGDYGEGYSDLEFHGEPAAQIGHSFTYATNQGGDPMIGTLAEVNSVRLSDGTRLTRRGALAAGVTVDSFDIYLYAVDAAFKYRGFSMSGEYYFRWLQSIEGDGPLPIDHLYDYGYAAEVGYFLVPKRLELIGRYSQANGLFGVGHEYAGGFTWFINGTHGCKLTLDLTQLNNNPVDNSGPNLRAGDDGLLVRTQLQLAF